MAKISDINYYFSIKNIVDYPVITYADTVAIPVRELFVTKRAGVISQAFNSFKDRFSNIASLR